MDEVFPKIPNRILYCSGQPERSYNIEESSVNAVRRSSNKTLRLEVGAGANKSQPPRPVVKKSTYAKNRAPCYRGRTDLTSSYTKKLEHFVTLFYTSDVGLYRTTLTPDVYMSTNYIVP